VLDSAILNHQPDFREKNADTRRRKIRIAKCKKKTNFETKNVLQLKLSIYYAFCLDSELGVNEYIKTTSRKVMF
jgi:hypothetical protein